VVGDESHDWVQTWNESLQAREVHQEIDEIHKRKGDGGDQVDDPTASSEFAMPFTRQLYEVTYRLFQQYWRMPSYIIPKMLLSGGAGLFIGFSFYNASSSLQGMQNVLYSLFMLNTIFSTLVQQIMPLFVTQRSLYEVRERPSKAYSWTAFLSANIIVEIPFQILAGLLLYTTFYYPVVGIQSSQRQGLVLLFCVVFLIFASTFAHMCIAAAPDAHTAGAIVTFLFPMTLIFNGVMQPPSALPGFWIFMWRVSPLTYWVGGMAATLLHGRRVVCSPDEVSIFNPPSGQSCGAYMQPYLTKAPGYLLNPDATKECRYCSISVADTFLALSRIYWKNRWRNFGLIWVYVFVNIAAAVLLYYFFRVRPASKNSKTSNAERARATGGMSEKPSPWPSLRRLWRSELGGQHDRPELEGSSGRRELVGSQRPIANAGQIAELSAGQREPESNDEPKDAVVDRNQQPAEMSATPGSPRGPLEPRDDAPTERVGEPEAESEWNPSNPPPIPYASKPRPQ
jgi:ABC-type multidrug transport system permease subunit